MGAHYCAICRQTTFGGKRHIFGKGHQCRLRVVLLKFLEKVKEAKRTIKKPLVEKFDGNQHEKKFWCYCCGLEIQKNITDGNMTVLHGGLLEHMASTEHRKNTHKFWWENKADPKLRDKVIISVEEIERLKAEVAKVLETYEEKEDEFIKQQADFIRAQEKQRKEMFESLIEHNAEPETSSIPNGLGTSAENGLSSLIRPEGPRQRAGPSTVDPMAEAPWPGVGQHLTFIGHQDSSSCGNVHTGAVPPWLQDDPLEGCSGSAAASAEIGPSLQGFLKHKEQEKLKKLPPNRVGADFDHSSHTDANWLPSFGRVWNSGRRWQSRDQFRQEEGRKHRQKRKREHNSEGVKKPKPT